MSQRFALYYAPPTSSPLWVRAAHWLGRDPAGTSAAMANIPGIDAAHRLAVSKSARRYGFHATLKAPMALADGTSRTELEDAVGGFGRTHPAVAIGKLKLASIDGFLALIPVEQSESLTQAAGEIVSRFESFRAPLGVAEREKRIANGGLSERQIELLDRYGYPYVLEEFRFHMTVTDSLADVDRDSVMAAATAWFAPLLEESFVLDRIVLFHEPAAGAPFERLDDYPLTAKVKVDA